MKPTFLATIRGLGWAVAARAGDGGEDGWRACDRSVDSVRLQETRPAPHVLSAPDPAWDRPGNVESLVTTGRPAAADAADGEGMPDNGPNPAQTARTVIVRNEVTRVDGGNRINTTYLSFKFPCLDRRGALIVEVPFNHYNLVDPVRLQLGGLGDVKLQLNYNAWVSDDRA